MTALIKPGWEWPGHRPGQYVRLGIAVDGIHHCRAYSLTSDPARADGCIAITPKLVEGGKAGNLSFQVEHHLFPDMPSSRYAEIAPRVRDICRRYGLPYNTGPLSRQLGTVHRTILRLAFPGGKPRPKPGPYRPGHRVT